MRKRTIFLLTILCFTSICLGYEGDGMGDHNATDDVKMNTHKILDPGDVDGVDISDFAADVTESTDSLKAETTDLNKSTGALVYVVYNNVLYGVTVSTDTFAMLSKVYLGTDTTSGFIKDCDDNDCLMIYPKVGWYVGLGTCTTFTHIGYGGTGVNEIESLGNYYIGGVLMSRGDPNSFINMTVPDDAKWEIGGWRWLWVDEGANDNLWFSPNQDITNWYINSEANRSTWVPTGLSVNGGIDATRHLGANTAYVASTMTVNEAFRANTSITLENATSSEFVFLRTGFAQHRFFKDGAWFKLQNGDDAELMKWEQFDIIISTSLTIEKTLTVNEGTVLNEGGIDVDFRVESADESNAFKVDGQTNEVSVAKNFSADTGYYASTVTAGGDITSATTVYAEVGNYNQIVAHSSVAANSPFYFNKPVDFNQDVVFNGPNNDFCNLSACGVVLVSTLSIISDHHDYAGLSISTGSQAMALTTRYTWYQVKVLHSTAPVRGMSVGDHEITVSTTGAYYVSADITFTGAVKDKTIQFAVLKNNGQDLGDTNASLRGTILTNGAGTHNNVGMSGSCKFPAGTVLELWVRCVCSDSNSITIIDGDFSAFKL